MNTFSGALCFAVLFFAQIFQVSAAQSIVDSTASDSNALSVATSEQVGASAIQAKTANTNLPKVFPFTTQTITFPNLVNRALSTTPLTLSVTATSGLGVALSSATTSVCTVTGNVVAMLTVGTCTIRANQLGSASFLPAPQVTQSFVIFPAGQAIIASASLSSSQNPSTVGQSVTLTATFAGSSDSKTAVFTENITSLSGTTTSAILCDRVTIANQVATCAVPAGNRTAGIHAYAVRYQDESNSISGTASMVQLISVNGTTVSLSATPIRPTAGQPLTLTALVTGNRPTGTVRLRDSDVDVAGCASVTLASLPLGSGNAGIAKNAIATCTIATITAGTRSYTAAYSGDANNAATQAMLSFAVAATGPRDYSDLWWAGAGENGWGMTIMQKGLTQFNAFYVYDNVGNPIWYVMPGGSWNTDFTAFTGALYQTTSSPYNAYDTTKFTVLPSVGTATLTFTSASAANFDFTINGQTARKKLERQPFGVADPAARLVIRDLWWSGSNENGWGISIAQQDRTLFAIWFTYDTAGKPTWFVLPGGTWDENVFTGALYNTSSSPWLGASYDPSKFKVKAVGTMSLNFTDQDNVTMTYTIGGVTQSKVITRQPY